MLKGFGFKSFGPYRIKSTGQDQPVNEILKYQMIIAISSMNGHIYSL